VDTLPLTTTQRDALIRLVDDQSAAVRQALLAQFGRLGQEGVELLQELTRQPNRLLARHASWFLQELKLSDPVAEFVGFIRSLNYELETGALLLSRTVNPDFDLVACCTRLDELAARCRQLIAEPAPPRNVCRVLNRVLFHEHGFHGNVQNYTDPLNSYLDQVLVRRMGIPISLSIVYLLVAQRIGLDLEPVGVPGHFMVGCYLEPAPFFIDAFNQGTFRTAEDVLALLRQNSINPHETDLMPTPVREVLCRCCRNLVNHYTAANDTEHARLFADFVAEFEATHERHARP